MALLENLEGSEVGQEQEKSSKHMLTRESSFSLVLGGTGNTQERKSRAELHPLVSRGPDLVSSYPSVGGVGRSCKGLV